MKPGLILVFYGVVLAAWPTLAPAQSYRDYIRKLQPSHSLLASPDRGMARANSGQIPAAEAPAAQAEPPVVQQRVLSNLPVHDPVRPVPRREPESTGTLDINVNFQTGSAQLTTQATRKLDDLGRALSDQSLSNYRFRIEGHTDLVGARDINVTLSQRRAAAVADYITRHFAVSPGRLEPVGVGPDEPLVQTAAGVAEYRNRRVHVVNIGS